RFYMKKLFLLFIICSVIGNANANEYFALEYNYGKKNDSQPFKESNSESDEWGSELSRFDTWNRNDNQFFDSIGDEDEQVEKTVQAKENLNEKNVSDKKVIYSQQKNTKGLVFGLS